MSDKVRNFKWNENRCEAAKKLSAGIETNETIAKAAGINDRTLRRWKEDKEFMAYVDKLTLENEMATRAGMLRALYRGASVKADQVDGDKSTHLDYMKEIGSVQGLKTQKIEHSGEIEQNVVVYLPGNDRDELPSGKADVKLLAEEDRDTTTEDTPQSTQD